MSTEVRLPERPIGRVHSTQLAEARTFALEIVRDPIYRQNLKRRAISGRLAPAVEVALFNYAWGKPAEHVELGPPGAFDDLDDATPEQLRDRAQLLLGVLEGEVISVETKAKEDIAETAMLQQKTDAARSVADAHTSSRAVREALKALSSPEAPF